MKTIIFPGSFDPITNGHIEIIEKGLQIADTVIVAVTININKNYLIAIEDRIRLIEEATKDLGNVKVISSEKMMIDICRENDTKYIIRGLRNHCDFDFEMSMNTYNNELDQEIETIYFMASSANRHISSSGVKEVLKYKKTIKHLVPENVTQFFEGEK